MDTKRIRESTRQRLTTLGLALPAEPPSVLCGPIERTERDVVARVLVLGLVCLSAEGLDPAVVQQEIETFALAGLLTDLEQASVSREMGEVLPLPLDFELSWQIEVVNALLWTVNLAPEVSFSPDQAVDSGAILDPLLSAKSVEEVAEGASFRPLQEIVEEADYFRCYRALYREASPAGIDVRQQPIGPLEALSVVHCAKALEWVLDSSLSWEDPMS